MSPRRRQRRPFPIRALLLVFVVGAIAGWAADRALHPGAGRGAHPAQRRARVAALPRSTAPPVEPSSTVSEAPTTRPAPVPTPKPPALATPLPERTAASVAGEHRLAIIIDDCGQWPDTERALVALPVPMTFSILPSVRYTETIESEASAAGKGIMLHLPMEPLAHLDPGPGKITTAMTDAEIDARVRADLAQLPLARGVNNHEGSKATADPRVMRDVVAVLADEGRFFVDSWTSPESVGQSVAAAAGIPTAGRDVFLDNQADVAYTEGQIRAAAAVARRDGSAIAIGHPRPTTLAALRATIPELQGEGIDFVLAQDLVRRRGGSGEPTPAAQRSPAQTGP